MCWTLLSREADLYVVDMATRKLRVLCLHGFRTSGEIMRVQLRHFPKDLLDMHFVDSPNAASGFVCARFIMLLVVVIDGSK